MAQVDVVIVSHNSRKDLRRAAESFVALPEVHVFVVDNASSDGSLDTIKDLSVTRLPMPRNGGFAYGCNAGWRQGSAPFVLFLNPDAQLSEDALARLVRLLGEEARIGIVAPRIVGDDGKLHYSQRRFVRLGSTYAQALFLHRFFPRAGWSDELVRDVSAYDHASSPEWVSGACLVIRRSLLEELGGWDERFFMYCEDMDLCRRVRDLGYDVRYTPEAVAVHTGGRSAPGSETLPILAQSRILYMRKHGGLARTLLERAGIALGAMTHIAVARRSVRIGHARSLRYALTDSLGRRSSPSG